MALTEAMRRALTTAAARERGNICPVKGLSATLHAAAQMSLINAMVRRGYADMDGGGRGVPLITQAGRDVLAETN